jgi:hypothetical protein
MLTPSDETFNRTTFYIVGVLSVISTLVAVVIACGILALVWRTKRLHTVNHLMMCNTGVCSIFYCVVGTNNLIFLDLLWWNSDTLSCRWRAFFSYMSISAVVYSYFLQAISRFFFSVLSMKYRWVTTFKTHLLLIFCQWLTVMLIPLPAVLTQDIDYRPFLLCLVSKAHILHVVYSFFAYYLIPIVLIVAIYIYIYRRVKHGGNNTHGTTIIRRSNRDLELLRNIMILLGIYIAGALPTTLYLMTNISILYFAGIVCISFSIAIEKLFTIILDREIRIVVKKVFNRSKTRVTPAAFNITVAPTKLAKTALI